MNVQRVLFIDEKQENLRPRVRAFVGATLALTICFASPLLSLVRFAFHSDLYSHILLLPFVSLYLIWLNRRNLALDSAPKPVLAVVPVFVGLGLLGGYWLALSSGWAPKTEDYLSIMTLSFLSLVLAAGFLFLGIGTLRASAFPAVLLAFAAPFPRIVLQSFEAFLQRWSADVAHGLFVISGTPVLRQDMHFQLPGFSLQVAPECSGIHSTLALFITSLVAGYLLLRNPWRCAVLALAVFPLALLRNGFRIFVIGQLCVQVSPDMISSYIHRKGGPIFFGLSLVPLFLLLFFLIKSERHSGTETRAEGKATT